MRFPVGMVDEHIFKNEFRFLFLVEETWLEFNKKFISHEDGGRRIYYRGVRVIRFSPGDLLAMPEEDRTFFENGGVEGD